MDIQPGLRVVRGPDWAWGDQDGGEGCVGTVAKMKNSEDGGKAVVVQWDAGNRCNYSCGIKEKYDLRVYDSAQIGVRHVNIICDSCRDSGIYGIRWKCAKCHDYDLCTLCYNAAKHNLDHEFLRYDRPDAPRIHVPPRLRAKRLTATGLFPNAEVIRGHDWIWGEQDGGLGKTGRVNLVKGHSAEDNATKRNVVEVEWRETKKKNQYRAGYNGLVDVKCKEVGSGGYYYPEHLQVLGAPYQDAPPVTQKLASGDNVRVQLDIEVFKAMQEGHGGWNDQMAEIIGELGTIASVLDSGDVRVRYKTRLWTLNPDALTKVDNFKEGDVIRVINDMAEVHALQDGHGGWVDDIALALGQVGRVVRVFPTGDLRIKVNGKTWTFNPQCVVPAPGENPPESLDASGEDELNLGDIGLHLLSLLDNPAVVVAAAASGDASTLKTFLHKHPTEVNAKAAGKAAIHCAAVAGHIDVLKAILEFSPDLEVQDEDGDTALHLSAYSDENEAAQILINAGSKVNPKNHKEATPTMIAAIKGHTSVLRILVNHPNIQLADQDADGDTALHCAVLAQKNESVALLLEAGADPTLLNFRLFTPIHEAAKIGFLPAIEQFIRKCPQHINIKKDDGYTPLHLASMNDHLDVVTALIDNESCNINITSNDKSTALHLAVHRGNSKVVERLVGFGSDLNTQDKDGDTPLHLALMKESADPLTDETPQLKKVRDNLHISEDSSSHAGAIIACFLVQEGANIYVQNKKGHTPLQICAPDIAALITSFIGKSNTKKFHSSLCSPPVTSPVVVSHTSLKLTGEKLEGLTVGDKPPTSPVIIQKEEQASLPADPEESCFLCDATVDVKFEPCDHAVMCSGCAQRAKKCPKCRQPVKSFSKLVKTCGMCSTEEATVTVRPCAHQFCPACARRMKSCFDCKAKITSKEGLPPETSAPSSNASNCPICLTEPKDTAFLCGHQYCWECAQKVDHCPVCRKFVTHRIQLFQ